MSPQEQVQAVSRALSALLHDKAVSARALSKRLRRHPAYLSRALRGIHPLRVEVVFAALERLGRHPEEFFRELYPLGGETILRLEAGQGELDDEEGRALSRLAERHRGVPLRPAEYRLRLGELLQAALKRAAVSQRRVSLAMGKSAGALGEALRGNSQLHFLQVFTVLDAAGVDPGRLFFELFLDRPDDVLKRLRQARSVELLEQALIRAAQGYLSRRAGETAAGTTAPGRSVQRRPGPRSRESKKPRR